MWSIKPQGGFKTTATHIQEVRSHQCETLKYTDTHTHTPPLHLVSPSSSITNNLANGQLSMANSSMQQQIGCGAHLFKDLNPQFILLFFHLIGLVHQLVYQLCLVATCPLPRPSGGGYHTHLQNKYPWILCYHYKHFINGKCS